MHIDKEIIPHLIDAVAAKIAEEAAFQEAQDSAPGGEPDPRGEVPRPTYPYHKNPSQNYW
ncbi:MAG: hypothetical protein RDV48_20000 [Candidatus Eremiobacteraeota bacterium]|nr:hypothetical protein [Candidatus Eremiobacteraeota bacterium]